MLEVIPSVLEHAKRLSLTLRQEDVEEAKALGVYPHRGVFYAYRHACYKMTALVDGDVAAMWGLHGELLGSVGHPYFLTGTAADNVSPLAFVRLYKSEVQKMQDMFPVLENYVDARHTRAVRLLRMTRFDLLGPVKTVTGIPFYKYTRTA